MWDDIANEWMAVSLELPMASASGATAEAAITELAIATEMVAESMVESGHSLPRARSFVVPSGQFRLRLPVTLHHALTDRAEAEGVSLNSMAITFIAAGLGLRGIRDEF
jgi:antitoxin HicB